MPLGTMKFVETEDAGISLGPGLGVSKYTGRGKNTLLCLIVREACKENIKKNNILELYS